MNILWHTGPIKGSIYDTGYKEHPRPQWQWHFGLQQVDLVQVGLGALWVKACVGGPHHQPSWGCSRRCRPLWGNRTAPRTLWRRLPAGGTLDSSGSARSCRNGSRAGDVWSMSLTSTVSGFTVRPDRCMITHASRWGHWKKGIPHVENILTRVPCLSFHW